MQWLGDYVAVGCEALLDCVVDATGVYVDYGHVCATGFARHDGGEEANGTRANYKSR
jgi:hypothetical protein